MLRKTASNQSKTRTIHNSNNQTTTLVILKKRKREKKNVSWDSSVIDNEFMNKKKSKKCCIFHKPRAWDESSSDESSSSANEMNDSTSENHRNKKLKVKKNISIMNDTQIMVKSKKTSMKLKRNEQTSNAQNVSWDESVIDNEFMNKKKSNKCCIYRKPRIWDESSSESESESNSNVIQSNNDENGMVIDVHAIGDDIVLNGVINDERIHELCNGDNVYDQNGTQNLGETLESIQV